MRHRVRYDICAESPHALAHSLSRALAVPSLDDAELLLEPLVSHILGVLERNVLGDFERVGERDDRTRVHDLQVGGHRLRHEYEEGDRVRRAPVVVDHLVDVE